jgi:hypothetical protein
MSMADAFWSFKHLHVGARGQVDRLDDPLDAPHVARVIGDHDRVVVRIRGDEVVRGHQRAQHRHELHGRFVLQHEDLRDDAIAGHARGIRAGGPRARLRFGFGNDLHEPVALDRRVALHAQRREEDLVEQRPWRPAGRKRC